MALADLTFKFYTDSGLTTEFSGLYQLVHETDLSDNPQDKVLYFGSIEADGTRKLQATSSPGVDNITLTPTYILDQWVAATAYALGDLVEPVTPNTYKYEVTTAGTSHAATEPTWPTTIGSTVADGTVIWTCVAKAHTINEIKMASTSGGLSGSTPGAAFSMGAEIESGVSNAVQVNIRFSNSVTSVDDNTGFPELGLVINEVQEVVV